MDRKNSENIQTALALLISRSLPCWFPTASRPLAWQQVQRKSYRWSEHLIYDVTGNGAPVGKILVKMLNVEYKADRRQDGGIRPEAEGLFEFQALHSIHNAVIEKSHTDLCAVRPLAFDHEQNALITEFLPSESLFQILRKAAAGSDRSAARRAGIQIAGQAGKLLSLIHQSPYPNHAITADSMYEVDHADLKSKVERLRVMDPSALSDSQLDQIDLWAQKSSSSKFFPGTIAALHGDYYPRNILRALDGRVFTLDTTLSLVGPVEADIAKFITGIEFSKLRLLSLGLIDFGSYKEKIVSSFLEGYRASGGIIVPIKLILFRISALLQRWIEILEVLMRFPIPGVKRIASRYFIAPAFSRALDALLQSGPKEQG